MNTITWSDFEKVEIRIGTIIEANDFPKARKPAFQLTIDFGLEVGIKKTSELCKDKCRKYLSLNTYSTAL